MRCSVESIVKMKFTENDLNWFAAASCDVNPLHRDYAYASRTAYGQCVVFGILGGLAVLSELSKLPFVQSLNNARHTDLQMEFRHALYAGRDYTIDVIETPNGVEGRLMDGDAMASLVRLTVLQEAHDDPLSDISILDCIPEALPELRVRAASLSSEDVATAMPLKVSYRALLNEHQASQPDWLEAVQNGFGAELITLLMSTSYLVGMELPGESALFSKLSLTLDGYLKEENHSSSAPQATSLVFAAKPDNFHTDFGLLKMAFAARQGQSLKAEGSISAFARKPVKAPDGDLVQQNIVGQRGAFKGKSALVTGGSRGLGAALVQGLASLGCEVYLAFQHSNESAQEIKASCAGYDGNVKLVQGDVSSADWCQKLAAQIDRACGGLDLLVCNAATPPTAMVGKQHNQEIQQYVDANLAISLTPLETFGELVARKQGAIVAVSSVFVEERPSAFSHYVSLKEKVEVEVARLVQRFPEVRAFLPRAPKMATAMSNTPQGAIGALAAEDIAASIINAVLLNTDSGAAHLLSGELLANPNKVLANLPVFQLNQDTNTTEPVVSATGDKTSDSAAKTGVFISATFTADLIQSGIDFWADKLNLPVKLQLGDYNQVFQQLLNPSSEMAGNELGVNVALLRMSDWLRDFGSDQTAEQISQVEKLREEFSQAVKSFSKRSLSPVLVIICPSDSTLSLAHFESELTRELDKEANVTCFLSRDFHQRYRVESFHDPVRDQLGHIPYTADYYHFLGTLLMRFLYSVKSKPYKVIVSDCDNTLWKGVCGESGSQGVEASGHYLALQQFLKQQVSKGMLLCLCSKNDIGDVNAVFEHQVNWPLSLADCTANAVNWLPKSQNIRDLASKLNLGLNSFIFIDDNPVECAEVSANCPEVLIIQWPDNEDDARRILDHSWVFDRFVVTEEDSRRTEMYQAQQERDKLESQMEDYSAFLNSLALEIQIRVPNETEVARASQLTMRTNQFNFSLKRRALPDIKQLIDDDTADCLVVSAKDRFGDYGLVGVIILLQNNNQLIIDSFMLSCRVLGRGVEHRMMAHIGQVAVDRQLQSVVIEIQANAKNEPARMFLAEVTGEKPEHDSDCKEQYCHPTHVANITHLPKQPVSTVSKKPKKTDSRQQNNGSEVLKLTTSYDTVGALRQSMEQFESERNVPIKRDITHVSEKSNAQPDEGAGAMFNRAEVQDRILSVFSKHLKVPVSELNIDTHFEFYILDSFHVVELTVDLMQLFPALPTTLFYENQNIRQILDIVCPESSGSGSVTSKPLNPHSASEIQETSDTESPMTENRINSESEDKEVAIIGISCKLPNADSPEAFWDMLKGGQDAIVDMPVERWTAEEHAQAGNIRGGFIEDFDRFESSLFNISPREALYMDPQQRLFLESVWSLFENSGYQSEQLPQNTGVFVGVISNDYGIYSAAPAAEGEVPYRWTDYYQVANRVSYFFDFSGPSLTIDTACSSSGTAIHLACESLHRGESAVAIAGGVNLFLHPGRFVQYQQMGIISRSGVCRPFGEDADGTIYGEGVGTLLLKPLKDAEKDGDFIHGVIKSTSTNSGGRTNGFTVPNPNAHAELITQAFQQAKVASEAVGYIEAHGTGTSLGDPIEVRGLSKAFDNTSGTSNPDNAAHCGLGSVKGNIGHLESAAAVAGVIKVLLQMKHKQLAPSLNATSANPMIDFDKTPFYLVGELQEWERTAPDEPLKAGVSSFGAGGSNAHIVIEEYLPKSEADSHNSSIWLGQVFPFSAASATQLRALVERFQQFLLTQSTDSDLQRIAFTLQSGRRALSHRVVFMAHNVAELNSRLSGFLEGHPDAQHVFEGIAQEKFSRFFQGNNDVSTNVISIQSEAELRCQALLWSTGVSVQWEALYQRRSHSKRPAISPLPLPSYPFNGPGYYLPNKIKSAQRRTANGNPLTGRRIESPFADGNLYDAQFGTELLPYLADHRIHDKLVVPGSLYVALACTIANREGLSYPLQFKDVTFLKAIKIPQNENESVAVQSKWSSTNQSLEVQANESGQWQTRCSLNVANEPVVDTRYPSIEEVRERCTDYFSEEDFYQFGKTIGFHWTGGFHAVRGMYRGKREALGEVHLCESLYQDMDHCDVHPAFLDACFQSFVAALNDAQTAAFEPYMPLSIGNVCFYKKPPQRVWSYARITEDQHDRSVTFDIILFDENGEICADFCQMTALRASAQSLRDDGAQSMAHPWMYQNTWKPIDVAVPEELSAQRRLVVVAGEQKASYLSSVFERGHDKVVRLGEWSNKQALLDGLGHLDEHYFQQGSVVVEIPPVHESDVTGLTQQFSCAWQVIQKVVLRMTSVADGNAKLWIVTRGAQKLNLAVPDENILLSSIWGVGRSLCWEHPELWGGMIDLPGLPLDQFTMPVRTIFDLKSGEDHILLDEAGQFYGVRLSPVSRDEIEIDRATPEIQSDATYLVTGGAGSLGQQHVEWLVSHGARHLLILGRSRPSVLVEKWIDSLKERGVEPVFKQVDVADKEQLAAVLAGMEQSQPPLKGIIHTAGVVSDSLFINQTDESFHRAFDAKAMGAWYLHQLTLHHELDFFVCSSSASSVLGAAGQSNYIMANAFLDTLAQFRQLQGKPATSINWGPLEGSTMLSGDEGQAGSSWTGTEFGAIPLAQTGELLTLAITEKLPVIAYLPYDWSALVNSVRVPKLPSSLRTFEQFIKPVSATNTAKRDSMAHGVQHNNASPEDIATSLVQSINQLLGYDSEVSFGREQSFKDLGLDSLTAVKLRGTLNASFDLRLPATVAFDYPNVTQLAAHISEKIHQKGHSDTRSVVSSDPASAISEKLVNTCSSEAGSNSEKTAMSATAFMKSEVLKLSEQDATAALERELLEMTGNE